MIADTVPPLWYPKENFTKLPPMTILEVPDSIEQLMTYSNLKVKSNKRLLIQVNKKIKIKYKIPWSCAVFMSLDKTLLITLVGHVVVTAAQTNK